MRKIIIIMICLSSSLLRSQMSIDTIDNYKSWGWKAIVMQNDLITLATVPAIGGRVMQYDLGNLPSIMVNSDPNLLGKTFTPAQNGQWYNFGGYKTWPSPQDAWPGGWPPPPTLDYGAYTVLEASQADDSVALSILSPIEKWIAPNIQFKRQATIFPGTSRVKMEQTIINTSSTILNWGMWSIIQSIANHPGKTDYSNYWAYFPINPSSVFGSSGVSIQANTTGPWKGEVVPGVYGVQFDPVGDKIFADPNKGWIAYTDLSDSILFARTFPVFEGEQYPDGGARVTVYVSGNSPPLYMEIEVKAPVVALPANGGNFVFTENWWAAKVRAPVLDVNQIGAIANRISYNPATQILSAIYGVFYIGTACIAFVDSLGQTILQGQPYPVSPLAEFQLQDVVAIPNGTNAIEVRIYNTKKELVGVLDSVKVSELFTGIKNTTSALPLNFKLEQNYPNPFNPETNISYQLSADCHVTLKVYDIMGKEVKILVNEHKTAGTHAAIFNASNLPSGVYIYRIIATSIENGKIFDKSVKMMLLK